MSTLEAARMGEYVFLSAYYLTAMSADKDRLAALEGQNSNLQQLVVELLVANQRLRERIETED